MGDQQVEHEADETTGGLAPPAPTADPAALAPPEDDPADDAGNGGSASASGGATESDTKMSALVAGGGLVVLGLAIALLTADAIVSSLDSSGAVDRKIETIRFTATLLGAVVAGLGANTMLKAVVPKLTWWWQLAIAIVLMGVIVVSTTWFFVERPDQELVEGELSPDDPFEERVLVSGGNGYRYFVTLERSGTLQAQLRVQGIGSPIPGVVQEDGRIVAEGVLVGDATWTLLLSYVEGAGKYRVFVDSAGPESLTMNEEPINRAFDTGRSRAGYTFSLPRETSVFLQVESANQQAPTPGMLLRESDGTPIENVAIGEDGLIFTRVPRGDYVLAVIGSQNQRFRLTFDDRDPDSGVTAPSIPDPTEVVVPNVFGLPEQNAVAELSDAGFVVQTVPVCSNSMAADGATVGTTRQVVLSGATSPADEVEIVGEAGVRRNNLDSGTALDVKTFNGLPCERPRLGPDDKLYVGDRLSTGKYVVEMTADRGLVASTSDGDVWFESDVVREPGNEAVAIMQASDGNLVIYEFDPAPGEQVPSERVVWASGTDGAPGAYLSLSEQDGQGVAAVYDAYGELAKQLASSG